MSLKGDDKAALFWLPEEKERKLGGTFMGTSAQASDGAACYDL
jgi:hypothetical protein